ncbi:HDOD domain-containing protein [Thermodesulfovibrio sp.]|jgi:putative nucleotidyltransferase with HDIG domain|uniref:HDOD domain-containing protein n=1 Tax=Thermodesulfovibrio TaxID=28261 RepID=UPI00260FB3F3|nr:HDOD domain-containing protein [Thermodesulfovibrio sp.]
MERGIINKEEIERIIAKTIDIPSQSTIVFKVLNIFKNEFTSIEEIEALISKDKGFTARFIRLANSPFYGFSRKIKSVREALLLLGLDTAKSLILATSLRYLYRQFDTFEQGLWEHSLAVGICSSYLSEKIGEIKPQEALACGVLHDIGVVFLKNAFPDKYQGIYEKIYESERNLEEVEIELLGYAHTDVGAYVAEKWNFPEEIKVAIQYHHIDNSFEETKETFAHIHNLVRMSDLICMKLGMGFKKPINLELENQNLLLHDSVNSEEFMKSLFSFFREERALLLN